MSFARRSKKWVFSLPNNTNGVQSRSRKKKEDALLRAPDIRTVVRDQIASFDDLRIVEGVFHVVVQVFAAHFGARVRVSILERVFCRRRTSFEPFFIYKIRETFGEKVASFTSRLRRRADRNRMIHARRRKAAVFECSVDARWWSFFRCGSRGGRQRGVSGEKQFYFCGEKPLPFGEEFWTIFLDRKKNAKDYCEKWRKDDGFWRFLVSRTKSMTKI